MNRKCTQCEGFLRVKIVYDENKKFSHMEECGNFTTEHGGKFCSTGCAMEFINSRPKNTIIAAHVNEKGWYIGDQKIA